MRRVVHICSQNGVNWRRVGQPSSGVSDGYTWDAAGNPHYSEIDNHAIYYGANELNQMMYDSAYGIGAAMHSFDANGSLVHSAPYYPEEPIDTWSYTYDAKSRLTSASRRAYGATDFELVVSNRYDYLDRRVQKITSSATHTYFYDGWMLIKEVIANINGTTDVIEYHWGKDLSGTIGGAGGVGGLLYLSISNSSTPNSSTRQLYIPFYDAYGNIMGYWDAQGNVVAQYTYDAFGKLISISGPMADVFAIRYSTKYFDSETGLYYYGYRFYSPELMRWITRDPIEEEGGVNMYSFCGNFPLGEIDPIGEEGMLTGVLLYGHIHSRNFKRDGDAQARMVFSLLRKIADRKINNSVKMYNVEIKSLANTSPLLVASDVAKNKDNVYLIAHGGIVVNGEVYKYTTFNWSFLFGKSAFECVDPKCDGHIVPLSFYGNLEPQNIFGCFLSPNVRKQGFLKTSSTDKYPDMFNALHARLKRYLAEKRKCTTNITIYEGERVRGGPSTETTFKKWKKGDWHE